MSNQHKTISILNEDRLELGEGPTYDPDTDTAWWFDIVGKSLIEHLFDSGKTITHDLPRMGSVLARIDASRQLLAMDNGIYIRDIASGKLELRHPLEADDATPRSNDGRVHPSGSLWIGTMGLEAEKHAGAIYWYDGSELKTLFDKVTIPNAICFSPDGSVGYFTDSMKGLLMCVDVDPATGLPVSDPAVFYDHRGGPGAIDGAVVDRNGVLWNARWGAGAVDAYSPEGERIKSIALPASQTSCPAFCGQNGQDMIVTSAWQGQTEGQRQSDCDGGKTFLVAGGFEGSFDPVFKLPD